MIDGGSGTALDFDEIEMGWSPGAVDGSLERSRYCALQMRFALFTFLALYGGWVDNVVVGWSEARCLKWLGTRIARYAQDCTQVMTRITCMSRPGFSVDYLGRIDVAVC